MILKFYSFLESSQQYYNVLCFIYENLKIWVF